MGKDVGELSDDKNPGAFNVYTHCGKVMGTVCLMCDVLKGFVPVFVAGMIMDTSNILYSFVVFAPVLGHAVGMFNHFRGGKCIATSFGVAFGVLPHSFIFILLAALYILFSTVVKIPSHTTRTNLVYILFGCGAMIIDGILGNYSIAVGCVLVSATVIAKHIIALKRTRHEQAESVEVANAKNA
jgi:glycerol-3-phosphate acyltransferase PlsY